MEIDMALSEQTFTYTNVVGVESDGTTLVLPQNRYYPEIHAAAQAANLGAPIGPITLSSVTKLLPDNNPPDATYGGGKIRRSATAVWTTTVLVP